MLIRKETESDYNAIYDMVKKAFETSDSVSGGDEQDYINAMRADSSKYIPELALVAEIDGKIIGHIMFTKAYVRRADGSIIDVLHLAPLAVVYEYRKKGIGGALIRHGFEAAQALGYKAVFLAGEPAYYSRFGFTASYKHGIRFNCPPELEEAVIASGKIPQECIMMYPLTPDALEGVTGEVILM